MEVGLVTRAWEVLCVCVCVCVCVHVCVCVCVSERVHENVCASVLGGGVSHVSPKS